jgi:hypothetical protein
MDFNLSEYDGLNSTMDQSCCSYDSYKYFDRDKKMLHNGELKYFRDNNGYLCRGRIYHRLNMMFWIVINDSKTTVKADYELFDLMDSDQRCRVARKNTPKEYTDKVEFLSELSVKELERELRKRKRN